MNRLKRIAFLGLPIAIIAVLLLTRIAPAHAAVRSGCGSWSVVNSPSPNTGLNILNGIAVISTNNVWSVGYSTDTNGNRKTLIEHWNGTQWSVVPSPNPSKSINELDAVSAVSATDIWAVGHDDSNRAAQTLTEHWDGSNWGVVSSRNPKNTNGFLYGVTAISSNNIWAVGYSSSISQNRTLIEHWNGSRWSIVASPNPDPSSNILQGVTAISASDIWAVGWYQSANLNEGTIAEHWDGSTWSLVPSPNPVPGLDQLEAVTPISTNNVWAVGEQGVGTLIEHWNGKKWSPVNNYHGTPADLLGVAALSSNNIWAVGIGPNAITLTEHWDGSTWSVVNSPNPSSRGNILRGVAQVPGTNNFWSVGDYDTISSSNTNTLTEFYC